MALQRIPQLFRAFFIPVLLLATVSLPAVAQGRRATSGTSKKTTNEPVIAVVNGQPIPYSFFQTVQQDRISYLMDVGRGSVLNSLDKDELFRGLIDAALVEQEAARRGITINHKAAIKLLLENPPQYVREVFTDERGEFKKEIFRQTVQKPELISKLIPSGVSADSAITQWKLDLEKVIRYIRVAELRRRVSDGLMAASPITDRDIRHRYFAERTRISGSFVRVLHSTLPDSAFPISDAEARAWYRSHTDDYTVPPSRTVGSLILPVYPLAADSALTQSAMEAARTTIESAPRSERLKSVSQVLQNLPRGRIPQGQSVTIAQLPPAIRNRIKSSSAGDVIGPIYGDDEAVMFYVEDVVPTQDTILRARHILLSVRPGDAETDTSSYQLALALKENILNDSVFIEAAQVYSQDGSSKVGGDLGYFPRGQMLHEFDSAAFGANVGDVVGPVRTEFGYHLIRVIERITNAYRLREMRFPLVPSAQSRQQVEQDMQRYVEAIRTKQPIQDLMYELRAKYPQMVRDTSVIKRLQPYGDILEVNRFVFKAKVGDIATLDLPNNRLIAVQLLKIWPIGLLPYEAISSYPEAHARRQKQMDVLEPRVKNLADSITPEMLLGPLRDLAPMAEVFVLTNQLVSAPPDESARILDSLVAITQAGEVRGPVRGKHGYYFLRVVERSGPTEADFQGDREGFARDYIERYRKSLLDEKLEKLRQFAEVEDMR